jgi:hypothetical protein
MGGRFFMKDAKLVMVLAAALLPAVVLIMGGASVAATLSKEIAPDVPPEIQEKLLPDANVYLIGTGSKDVLLLADPFCENSRKIVQQLRDSREKIRTLRILWVSAYPQKGSEVVAAVAIKMLASGKGESALTVFDLDIPPSADIQTAQENALFTVNEKFGTSMGKMDLQGLKQQTDQVRKNTDLAKGIGYTGTPHFLVGGRVLHGYSSPAIRILLRQGSDDQQK